MYLEKTSRYLVVSELKERMRMNWMNTKGAKQKIAGQKRNYTGSGYRLTVSDSLRKRVMFLPEFANEKLIVSFSKFVSPSGMKSSKTTICIGITLV